MRVWVREGSLDIDVDGDDEDVDSVHDWGETVVCCRCGGSVVLPGDRNEYYNYNERQR